MKTPLPAFPMHADHFLNEDPSEAGMFPEEGELAELLGRYNRPVPRYTSYPPANLFTEKFFPSEYNRQLKIGRRPVSLYAHIPFCRQRCFFCGCNATMRREYLDTSRYVDALICEMEQAADLIGSERPVIDIHWGGGTPTFLTAPDLRRLGEATRALFNVMPDAGFSIEIDPRCVTPVQIETLAQIGLRRASIGVQDTTLVVQEAVNRVQPMSLNRQVIAQLRHAGIHSINIDLIYGLPHQTLESFRRTLEAVCSLDPDRIAVFGYAHLPEMIPVQRVLEQRGNLPSSALRLQLLQLAVETLTRAGYTYLGLDHFAKPSDPLALAYAEGRLHRNFNGYTDRGAADLIGVGPSAISESRSTYVQNIKDPSEWLETVLSGGCAKARGLSLSTEQEIRRAAIRQVLSQPHFLLSTFIDSFGTAAGPVLRPAMESMRDFEADGLIRMWDGGFSILPAGRFFNRMIAYRFDENWTPHSNNGAPRAHAAAI